MNKAIDQLIALPSWSPLIPPTSSASNLHWLSCLAFPSGCFWWSCSGLQTLQPDGGLLRSPMLWACTAKGSHLRRYFASIWARCHIPLTYTLGKITRHVGTYCIGPLLFSLSPSTSGQSRHSLRRPVLQVIYKRIPAIPRHSPWNMVNKIKNLRQQAPV